MTPIPFFHYFWPACFMAVIAINAANLVGWLQGDGWDGLGEGGGVRPRG